MPHTYKQGQYKDGNKVKGRPYFFVQVNLYGCYKLSYSTENILSRLNNEKEVKRGSKRRECFFFRIL